MKYVSGGGNLEISFILLFMINLGKFKYVFY